MNKKRTQEEDTAKMSDELLREIMQMEHEINKIMALNGNKENRAVKQYRQFIAVKQKKLMLLNKNYK